MDFKKLIGALFSPLAFGLGFIAPLAAQTLTAFGYSAGIGNIGSMGMQYHAIHHLYPRIPLSLTPAAFRELRPILIRKGMDTRGL